MPGNKRKIDAQIDNQAYKKSLENFSNYSPFGQSVLFQQKIKSSNLGEKRESSLWWYYFPTFACWYSGLLQIPIIHRQYTPLPISEVERNFKEILLYADKIIISYMLTNRRLTNYFCGQLVRDVDLIQKKISDAELVENFLLTLQYNNEDFLKIIWNKDLRKKIMLFPEEKREEFAKRLLEVVHPGTIKPIREIVWTFLTNQNTNILERVLEKFKFENNYQKQLIKDIGTLIENRKAQERADAFMTEARVEAFRLTALYQYSFEELLAKGAFILEEESKQEEDEIVSFSTQALNLMNTLIANNELSLPDEPKQKENEVYQYSFAELDELMSANNAFSLTAQERDGFINNSIFNERDDQTGAHPNKVTKNTTGLPSRPIL